MKVNLAMLLIFVFLSAFSACDRERPEISGESIITGVQNGTKWEVSATGQYYPGTDTVNMSGWASAGESKAFSELLGFFFIPFELGEHALEHNKDQRHKPSSDFYTFLGLDVPNCGFYLDGSSKNFIKVEMADPRSNYISGTFQAVYIRDSTNKSHTSYLPDTLRFTNGFFRVKIDEPG